MSHCMKYLRLILLPLDSMWCLASLTTHYKPFILLGGERHCKIKRCLTQEHSILPFLSRLKTALFRIQCRARNNFWSLRTRWPTKLILARFCVFSGQSNFLHKELLKGPINQSLHSIFPKKLLLRTYRTLKHSLLTIKINYRGEM